jgi:hypothetical protein
MMLSRHHYLLVQLKLRLIEHASEQHDSANIQNFVCQKPYTYLVHIIINAFMQCIYNNTHYEAMLYPFVKVTECIVQGCLDLHCIE